MKKALVLYSVIKAALASSCFFLTTLNTRRQLFSEHSVTSQKICEDLCREMAECQAVGYRDPGEVKTENCVILGNYVDSSCSPNPNWPIWLRVECPAVTRLLGAASGQGGYGGALAIYTNQSIAQSGKDMYNWHKATIIGVNVAAGCRMSLQLGNNTVITYGGVANFRLDEIVVPGIVNGWGQCT